MESCLFVRASQKRGRSRRGFWICVRRLLGGHYVHELASMSISLYDDVEQPLYVIARYVGRKGGLLGLESDADYAASEQLVQQFEDILTDIAKAHFAKPRGEAMTKALDESVAHKLEHVEKLAKGHTITGKVLLGDLAIFSALYIIVHDLRPNYLEKFPKLKAFYAHILADPDVKTIEKVQWGQWFKAVDDPQ